MLKWLESIGIHDVGDLPEIIGGLDEAITDYTPDESGTAINYGQQIYDSLEDTAPELHQGIGAILNNSVANAQFRGIDDPLRQKGADVGNTYHRYFKHLPSDMREYGQHGEALLNRGPTTVGPADGGSGGGDGGGGGTPDWIDLFNQISGTSGDYGGGTGDAGPGGAAEGPGPSNADNTDIAGMIGTGLGMAVDVAMGNVVGLFDAIAGLAGWGVNSKEAAKQAGLNLGLADKVNAFMGWNTKGAQGLADAAYSMYGQVANKATDPGNVATTNKTGINTITGLMDDWGLYNNYMSALDAISKGDVDAFGFTGLDAAGLQSLDAETAAGVADSVAEAAAEAQAEEDAAGMGYGMDNPDSQGVGQDTGQGMDASSLGDAPGQGDNSEGGDGGESEGGDGGTWICTAAYATGNIPRAQFRSNTRYGIHLRRTQPLQMRGYDIVGPWIAKKIGHTCLGAALSNLYYCEQEGLKIPLRYRPLQAFAYGFMRPTLRLLGAIDAYIND